MTPKKFARYALVATACAIFSFFGLAANADGKLGLPIDQSTKFPKDVKELYRFDRDGGIIDGPRQGLNQPIDFSPIFFDTLLTSTFRHALLNCPSDFRNCSPQIRRFESRNLEIRMRTTDALAPTLKERSEIHSVFEKTLGSSGFQWSVTDGAVNIRIFIGSLESIKELVRSRDPRLALQYDELGAGPSTVMGGGTCGVSTEKFQSQDLVELFITPSDINECLGRAFYVAIGFNEVFPNFSSILSTSAFQTSIYRQPTFFDKVFLELLYHSSLNSNFSTKDINEFVREHSESIKSVVLKRMKLNE